MLELVYSRLCFRLNVYERMDCSGGTTVLDQFNLKFNLAAVTVCTTVSISRTLTVCSPRRDKKIRKMVVE